MIKQIQLRGISRAPSDRANEDGGCAESLNVHLDNGETAPTLPPEDVTDTLAPGLDESGMKVLYIHKGFGYTNYIGTKDGDLCAWVNGGLETIREDCDVVTVGSTGNIVVYTIQDSEVNGRTGYALFKDGGYIDLEDGVPVPTVTFNVVPQSQELVKLSVSLAEYPTLNQLAASSSAQDVWDRVMERKGLGGEEFDFYNFVVESVWEVLNNQVNNDRNDGIFCAPVLARYAVKLYDGSYVYNSEPVMLSGGFDHLFIDSPLTGITKLSGQSGTDRWMYMVFAMNDRFKVTADVSFGREAANWGDLIESVDVFLSTDIRAPYMETKFSYAAETNNTPTLPSGVELVGGASYINFEGFEYKENDNGWEYERQDKLRSIFEREYIDRANFYRVAQLAMDETDEEIAPLSQDDLVVHPRLSESDSHKVDAYGYFTNYNRRLVTGEQHVTMSRGHSNPQGVINGATGTTYYYTVVYHIREANGVEHLVEGYKGKPFVPAEVRGYVAYPDPRCYQADLYIGTDQNSFSSMVILPMKEHPNLNCAYGFWGLNSLLEYTTQGREAGDPTEYPQHFSGSFVEKGRLALTETDNPFSFPLAQRVSFQSEVIAALPLTLPPSPAQFGQFDLYAFTDEGIYVVRIDDEGGAASSHYLSQDVAVRGTVTQINQGIVFVSEQGVMILQGSGIVNISPNMVGRHYVLDASVADVVSRSEWAGLLPFVSDDTPFMAFAEECRIAYDYAGRRILLLNPDEIYQYVYMFDTQTWHKTAGELPEFTILNSYPDCLVSTYDSDDVPALLNFSTVMDDEDVLSDDVDPVDGMIVTRTMDLGEPDIRKVIHDIRIRGRFNRGDVKYLMLGSMDGIHWKRLLSKGGGSYNLFRFVILTKLSPTERISWIDVDYDRRFANKLR